MLGPKDHSHIGVQLPLFCPEVSSDSQSPQILYKLTLRNLVLEIVACYFPTLSSGVVIVTSERQALCDTHFIPSHVSNLLTVLICYEMFCQLFSFSIFRILSFVSSIKTF